MWAWGPLRERSHALERCESPDISDADLQKLLRIYQSLGQYFGGFSPILRFLDSSRSLWPTQTTVSILDIRCGLGGLSRALVRWASRNKIDVRIHAIDSYGRIIQMAKDQKRNSPLITYDVRSLKDPLFLQAQQYDYVVGAFGLHHESNEGAKECLKIANRLARRGVAFVEPLRDIRIYYPAKIFRLFLHQPDLKKDWDLFFRKGFSVKEMRSWADQTGLSYALIRRENGVFLQISGERNLVFSREYQRVAGLAGT